VEPTVGFMWPLRPDTDPVPLHRLETLMLLPLCKQLLPHLEKLEIRPLSANGNNIRFLIVRVCFIEGLQPLLYCIFGMHSRMHA
jgi:hypothetical protein